MVWNSGLFPPFSVGNASFQPPWQPNSSSPSAVPWNEDGKHWFGVFFPSAFGAFLLFLPPFLGVGGPSSFTGVEKGGKAAEFGSFPPPPLFFFSHKWRNFLFYKGEMFPFHRFSPNNGCFYLSLFHPIALVLLLYCFAPPVSITAFPHLNQGTQI